MKYTGTTYRPPLEANTPLLQVTTGCAHNECTFCTMYKDIPFTTEHMDQIKKDLNELKMRFGKLSRIFLVNGDAFVLSTRRLSAIAEAIIEVFPDMETISMYASIRNIRDKSDQDLLALKNLRINDLWVGLETGHADTLTYLNKGYSLEEAYGQLGRLNQVDIRFNGIFMLGIAGTGKGQANARDTAALINETKPQLVGFTSLGVFPGSQLEVDVNKGLFTTATELEVLEEEKALLEQITVEGLPFFANHPTNAASVSGILPMDRKAMILEIDETIAIMDQDLLEGSYRRFSL